MKDINPKTLLIAAGIITLVAVAAYYGGATLAVTECSHYFSSVDGDGDSMPEKTRFDFFEKKGGEWVGGGSYTIPANDPFGKSLWLKSDTQYKAVPVWYEAAGWATPDDWTLPPAQTFYGCSRDCVFVYKAIICTPNTAECEGDVLYTCNSDGTRLTSKTCTYGCSGGACNDPPAVPCAGLPTCSSTTGWFQECCDDKIWTCYWNNYDGAGYRFQWELAINGVCDTDCTCDGAASEQECWCADLTPDCTGLGVCDHGVYLCDDCCGGDVWECTGQYKWILKESCTADETCECSGDNECLDCDCIPTATPTPTPSPAQIDDATDTLTFDKSSYHLGDTVIMYATGTNIGGEEWHGKVTFTITQPDGTEYTVEESTGINVAAGNSATADESFILPSPGQVGTWTAQSKWIDNDGNIHARSSILDLGEGDMEDYSMWVIGGIAVFLLLLYFAYRKQTKR